MWCSCKKHCISRGAEFRSQLVIVLLYSSFVQFWAPCFKDNSGQWQQCTGAGDAIWFSKCLCIATTAWNGSESEWDGLLIQCIAKPCKILTYTHVHRERERKNASWCLSSGVLKGIKGLNTPKHHPAGGAIPWHTHPCHHSSCPPSSPHIGVVLELQAVPVPLQYKDESHTAETLQQCEIPPCITETGWHYKWKWLRWHHRNSFLGSGQRIEGLPQDGQVSRLLLSLSNCFLPNQNFIALIPSTKHHAARVGVRMKLLLTLCCVV